MYKTLILLFTLYFLSVGAYAQSSSESDNIIYNNEQYIGGVFHNNGLGINFRRGYHKTGYQKHMLDVQLLNMKHPKEVKNTSHPGNYKDYVYGKLNSLMILRSGYGLQHSIFPKDGLNGVEIRLGYYGGLSLGMVKPVYLYVSAPGKPNGRSVEKYNPDKHYSDNIYGRASYIKGLGETSFRPGVYGRLSLSFEYAAYDELIRALETGITLDAYPKTIPIMAKTDNNQVYFSVYLGLYFGRKWF